MDFANLLDPGILIRITDLSGQTLLILI